MTRTMMVLAGLAVSSMLWGCDLDQPYYDMDHSPPPGYDAGPSDEAAQLQPVDPEPAPPVAEVPEAEQDNGLRSADAAQTYTVRKGDTLWSIAEQAYGDGQRWRDIVDANPNLRPEELRVGQQLTLP